MQLCVHTGAAVRHSRGHVDVVLMGHLDAQLALPSLLGELLCDIGFLLRDGGQLDGQLAVQDVGHQQPLDPGGDEGDGAPARRTRGASRGGGDGMYRVLIVDDEENVINAALNYGYSLILSAVNREVSANGYLTQLGLWHDNQFNHFNLSCDIMEPVRIVVDEFVYNHEFQTFETEEKHLLASILNESVHINHTEQNLLNAVKIYVKSIFDALNKDRLEEIHFIEI